MLALAWEGSAAPSLGGHGSSREDWAQAASSASKRAWRARRRALRLALRGRGDTTPAAHVTLRAFLST